MRFTWDPRKASANVRKHGVTFEEAVTVFADPLAWILDDALHAERALLIGASLAGRTLVIVYVEIEDDVVRIISARRATNHERRNHEDR